MDHRIASTIYIVKCSLQPTNFNELKLFNQNKCYNKKGNPYEENKITN